MCTAPTHYAMPTKRLTHTTHIALLPTHCTVPHCIISHSLYHPHCTVSCRTVLHCTSLLPTRSTVLNYTQDIWSERGSEYSASPVSEKRGQGQGQGQGRPSEASGDCVLCAVLCVLCCVLCHIVCCVLFHAV